MRKEWLFTIFVLLFSTEVFGQESRHKFSAHLVTGLDQITHQSININNGNDEFLNDNSIGGGLSYSYRLNRAVSIIGSADIQEIKGSVNTAESEYLNTSNKFYSVGFQFHTENNDFNFDLSFLFVDTDFKYRLNNENRTNRSAGSGAKLGVNYNYWLSGSSGLKIGIYSYGVMIGSVDLFEEQNNNEYHDSNLGSFNQPSSRLYT